MFRGRQLFEKASTLKGNNFPVDGLVTAGVYVTHWSAGVYVTHWSLLHVVIFNTIVTTNNRRDYFETDLKYNFSNRV